MAKRLRATGSLYRIAKINDEILERELFGESSTSVSLQEELVDHEYIEDCITIDDSIDIDMEESINDVEDSDNEADYSMYSVPDPSNEIPPFEEELRS
uniref:Uncharacterized protein n=1 Tax=Anopheles minimus TaxID=112268 RepID=A0A182WP48_9DIPT